MSQEQVYYVCMVLAITIHVVLLQVMCVCVCVANGHHLVSSNVRPMESINIKRGEPPDMLPYMETLDPS